MLKKMLLLAAFIIAGVKLTHAGPSYSVPEGPSSQIYTSDYAGVSYSTVSLSSANVQHFVGAGVFQGIMVSSFAFANPPQYILIRDTESLLGSTSDYNTHAEVFRVELTTGSWASGQSSNDSNGIRNFYYKPPYPIRMKRGLATKAVDATVRMYNVLWTKFE